MRGLVLLLPLLALSACGGGGRQEAVNTLQHRLHVQLADAARAGLVVEQDMPDGARVIFPQTPAPLTHDPRTDMIEALIDPGLLHLAVTAPAGLPPEEAAQRVQAWEGYFYHLPIAQTLEPLPQRPPVATPAPVPGAMAVTIAVVCTNRYGHVSYGDGEQVDHCF